MCSRTDHVISSPDPARTCNAHLVVNAGVCARTCVCVCPLEIPHTPRAGRRMRAGPYLQLLQKVQVLLPQAADGLLQLCCPLRLAQRRWPIQQLVLQHVVLHLVGLQLLGQVHLEDLPGPDGPLHIIRRLGGQRPRVAPPCDQMKQLQHAEGSQAQP